MDDGVRNLLDLAHADSRIFQLTTQLARIPLQLADARRPLDAESRVVGELEAPWNQCTEDIRQKEATIQVALETIAKFEAHMRQVTSQKAYVAAKKQVDEARKINDRLQNEILELRIRQEQITPRLTDARERQERVLAVFREREGQIMAQKEGLERELALQESLLEQVAQRIADRWMAYYHRLRKAGLLPAIVQAVAGACTGCNMALPPQVYNRLLALTGDFLTCSHCSRILYYEPPEAQTDLEVSSPPLKAAR